MIIHDPRLPSGFIAWHGGANPLPGKRVQVIYRGSNAPARPIYEADKVDWAACSSGPQVVAYKEWAPPA